VMNELFINVKVDREERPDLDRIYQLAHQMLIQRGGGWPLTMFLSPIDHRPFFGGTYFPKETRYGMPAFTDLLRRVAEFYATRAQDIAQQSEALKQAFDEISPPAADAGTALTDEPMAVAREMLAREFDSRFGGFGRAPKFPHPATMNFLLRTWRASAGNEEPDLHALYMETLTLTRMCEGGIYDQLGGGFARYSVDEFWMIPHFEKMLYDNGQLLSTLSQAALATGDPLFHRTAAETADWIMRDMQSPNGAYWSTLDADSEGHEGLFYVWDPAEARSLLDASEYEVFSRRFGLDQPANFEGRWHLHVYRSLSDIATELGMDESEAERLVNSARGKLLSVRNKRIWPGRDEKILTSWNGLAITGMTMASRALRRSDLQQSAQRAIDFLRAELWRDGRLLAVHKDGRSRFPAYLDDYAFLLDGLLEQLQTHWRSEDLAFANELARALLNHFEDKQNGGFYFTADDHEALMHRSRTFSDEAVPSGNAIAAQALTRLGFLLGATDYLDAAARTIRASWSQLERYPHGHAAMLIALEEHLDPPQIVIIRGDEADEWREELQKLYAPRRLIFAIPSDARDLPPALADKKPLERTVAYVCTGMTCTAPVLSLEALSALT
jgi:uncharacterized protein